MTSIYFSVSLKPSGHESRILGESYVTYFFNPTSKSSTNLYTWTHCKSGSGYTGRLGHAYARPSRTAETKCAFGATRQHPQGGGREALSNPFWFLLIINVQYEYNSTRLRQLTYFHEITKMNQKWDPSAGYFRS